MTRPVRFPLVPLLLLALLLTLLAAIAIGPLALSPRSLVSALLGSGAADVRTILWQVRLPRALAAALAGFALGLCGAAMQGLLRNPLAEPGVMGVSASAALAATATVYFGLAASAAWLVPVASIIGASAATLLIAGAALRLRGMATLILIGVALSALAGAVMALFVNLAPNPFSLSDLLNWTAGSVANRDAGDIAMAMPFIALGCLLLQLTRRSLGALTLGEETAHALGVNLPRLRLVIIIGTGLATGGAVALAGMIGFVGLVAPHLVRSAVGHDPARLLLPAGLVGAILLVLADIGIRLFPWGNELHLGTVAALLGAPVFAVIALRGGTVQHG